MLSRVRQYLPNRLVNLFWHLPQAILANIYFGFPARKLTIIGVTGTSGKTTTSHLIYHLLLSNGYKVALISTISAKIGQRQIDIGLHVTNPSPFPLQALLKKIVDQGYTHLVLEVTSHGLDQYRTWGIHFAYGVLTNIAHEHLDYHKTLANYRQAKLKLIKASSVAVLNRLDPSFSWAKKIAPSKILQFSASEITLSCPTLPGDFNRANLAAATKVALDLNIPLTKINQAIATFPGIPGRMEFVQTKPFTIIIDFAHKPDALQAALQAVADMNNQGGRIIAVFGSAGLRDLQKRPLMGAIAARLADITILTAEDPRTEKVEDIIDQIAVGFKKHQSKSKGKLLIQPDRQLAINQAIDLAKPGDYVCLFGKSHEKSICFGTIEYPWSEHLAVKKALKRRRR